LDFFHDKTGHFVHFSLLILQQSQYFLVKKRQAQTASVFLVSFAQI